MDSKHTTQLDLTSPDDALAWLEGFKAKGRTEKKVDIEADATQNPPVQRDYQLTDYFLSKCGINAIKKLNSLVAPNRLSDLKFDQIERHIETYIKPRERLVVAERTNFLSTSQKPDENAEDFLARLREAARYCDFGKIKTAPDPEAEMIRLRFIAGLHDSESKIRLLESLRQDDTKPVEDLVALIQFRQQAAKFAVTHTEAPDLTIGAVDRRVNRRSQPRNSGRQQNGAGCKRCGNSHTGLKCPAMDKSCRKCGMRGHYERVCLTKSSRSSENYLQEEDEETETLLALFWTDEYTGGIRKQAEFTSIELSDRHVLRMQVDTGAGLSVISTKMWDEIGQPQLTAPSERIESFDCHKMKYEGFLETSFKWKGQEYNGRFPVVHSSKSFGLLGRDVLSKGVFSVTTHGEVDDVAFLPTVKGVKASMKLKDGVQAKFCKARTVPVPMESAVNLEIERLIKKGILVPIEECVENASPVVWQRKKNGGLRFCADYKVHMNDKILDEAYPLPNMESIFRDLKGAKHFARIDISSAYHQIELEESAQLMLVVNTSRGLLKPTRLMMGMKNASAIFQRALEQVLKGLICIIFQDDVLVWGHTESQLQKRLRAVRDRLKDKGFTINEDKSISCSREVAFLGFRISEEGIKPDEKHLQNIKGITSPSDYKEAQHFVGLMNFFGRLIPHFAQKVAPINEVIAKHPGKFQWTSQAERAFQHLKNLIAANPVVQPYSLEKEVTLTTDASEMAIAGVLTQEGHPVIYVSRKLSEAEQRYANIEREALAIVWSCQRLRQFLIGRKFSLHTDHKPLEALFCPNRELPKVASARILRWATLMLAFDYNIVYRPGSEIPHADALTRLRIAREELEGDNDGCTICYEEEVQDVWFADDPTGLSLEQIRTEYEHDPITKRIMRRIVADNWQGCSESEMPLKRVRDALTVEKGLIYVKSNIYVPPALREKAIKAAHDAHLGI